MKCRSLSLMLALLVSACGYHLVGQGEGSGAIPADVEQVVIHSVAGKANLLPIFKDKFAQLYDVHVSSVADNNDDVEVRIEGASENLLAVAFDSAGIANQYRLTISASLRVLRSGEALWTSDSISVAGDVFASGDVVGIEAQKESVAQHLRDEWVQKALSRLRSGF